MKTAAAILLPAIIFVGLLIWIGRAWIRCDFKKHWHRRYEQPLPREHVPLGHE